MAFGDFVDSFDHLLSDFPRVWNRVLVLMDACQRRKLNAGRCPYRVLIAVFGLAIQSLPSMIGHIGLLEEHLQVGESELQHMMLEVETAIGKIEFD